MLPGDPKLKVMHKKYQPVVIKMALKDQCDLLAPWLETTRNVGNFAIGVIDAGNAVRDSREQFSSLNGSIDIAAGMFKTTAKLTAGLGDAAGTAISAIPLVGPAMGQLGKWC